MKNEKEVIEHIKKCYTYDAARATPAIFPLRACRLRLPAQAEAAGPPPRPVQRRSMLCDNKISKC